MYRALPILLLVSLLSIPTNGIDYARVYYGSSIDSAEWSEWRPISIEYTSFSNVDFIDRFTWDISDPWWAISMFTCDNKGDKPDIATVQYWDGSSKQSITYWCPQIMDNYLCMEGSYGITLTSDEVICPDDSIYANGIFHLDTSFTYMNIHCICSQITFRTDKVAYYNNKQLKLGYPGGYNPNPGQPVCNGCSGYFYSKEPFKSSKKYFNEGKGTSSNGLYYDTLSLTASAGANCQLIIYRSDGTNITKSIDNTNGQQSQTQIYSLSLTNAITYTLYQDDI